MKSIVAKGEEFLALTDAVRSASNQISPSEGGITKRLDAIEHYEEATARFSIGHEYALRAAAEFLRDETIRLSAISHAHPNFAQYCSSQKSARALFENAIAALVSRN